MKYLLKSKVDGWEKIIDGYTSDEGYTCTPLFEHGAKALRSAAALIKRLPENDGGRNEWLEQYGMAASEVG